MMMTAVLPEAIYCQNVSGQTMMVCHCLQFNVNGVQRTAPKD